jgi:hypothetical protein
MTGKRLLTLSLLPFMLMSSAAYADSVASKKRHVSHEVRPYSVADDLAVNRAPSGGRLAPQAGSYYGSTAEHCAYQYQGGPKSNLWTCRR